jgi:hypothetical protein
MRKFILVVTAMVMSAGAAHAGPSKKDMEAVDQAFAEQRKLLPVIGGYGSGR